MLLVSFSIVYFANQTERIDRTHNLSCGILNENCLQTEFDCAHNQTEMICVLLFCLFVCRVQRTIHTHAHTQNSYGYSFLSLAFFLALVCLSVVAKAPAEYISEYIVYVFTIHIHYPFGERKAKLFCLFGCRVFFSASFLFVIYTTAIHMHANTNTSFVRLPQYGRLFYTP